MIDGLNRISHVGQNKVARTIAFPSPGPSRVAGRGARVATKETGTTAQRKNSTSSLQLDDLTVDHEDGRSIKFGQMESSEILV